MNQIKEEFKEEVISWAASDPLASKLPDGNCTARIVFFSSAASGWRQCNYLCTRTTSGGAASISRYLPQEFSCPSPVPCAPGLEPTDPRILHERAPYEDIINPLDLMCQGLY